MSEENGDVVRRVYDAALRGDTEAVISHLDPAVLRATCLSGSSTPTSMTDTTATGASSGRSMPSGMTSASSRWSGVVTR
jgi:hypothetical protein